MAKTWLTVNEAAKLTGYHPEHITRLIRQGRLKAQKVSIVWLVERKSVMAYLKASQESGEKRGRKAENSP